MTSGSLSDSAFPYQILAWLDDLVNGKYDFGPQVRRELFLDGLWRITLWADQFAIPPLEEPQLFRDTQDCIIRAFDATKHNDASSILAINESVEWLAYALVRSSHPQLGNDFERVTTQWYLMNCASYRTVSTREPLLNIVA